MRTKILISLIFMALNHLAAQLPSGSVAPDFYGKDVNGKVWRLYDLLAKDKIVVLEFSATWCPPCWSYHNSKAMQNLYAQYGPNGSNEMMVLFIEGDPKTNLDCLYGLNTCNYKTLGNWVKDADFPIIDDAGIAELYAVKYFPTIYTICPDKKLREIGQVSSDVIYDKTRACPVAFGQHNAGIFEFSMGNDLYEVCDSMLLTPQFALTNIGQQPLKSAQMQLVWNTEVLENITWEGNLPLYGNSTIKFKPLTIQSAGSLTAKITHINNGSSDADSTNNTHQNKFGAATPFGKVQKLLLRIRTDNFGDEIYWELRDEKGLAIEHGGNDAIGPKGGGKFLGGAPENKNAYNSNILIRDTLSLPASGCYSFHIVDSYGDGICCEWGEGYYRLSSLNDPTKILLSGGNFEEEDNRAFHTESIVSALDAAASLAQNLKIYPNPASDMAHIEWFMPESAEINLTVLNAAGQVVLRQNHGILPAGEQLLRLPLSGLPSGLYGVQVQIGCAFLSKLMVKE